MLVASDGTIKTLKTCDKQTYPTCAADYAEGE